MALWKCILMVFGAIVSAIFVAEEVRYARHGVIVEAEITSAAKKFAGFSQRRDGSSPRYLNQLTYQFNAGHRQISGSTTAGGWRDQPGELLTIQYLNGLPDHHRIHNPRLSVVRIFGAVILFGFLTSGLLVLRSAFGQPPEDPQVEAE